MRTATATLLLLVASSVALADYDAAQEARDKAERDAAQRAEQQKQQAIQAKKQEAEARMNAETMKSKRKSLGPAADGKSDAEVNRLYNAKVRKDTNAANQKADATRSTINQQQNEAAMKSVTGK